jgi:hypothetical protein
VGAVTLSKRTEALVDELLPLWQAQTKSEDTSALVARSAVNALLDLRAFTSEYDELDLKTRTAA